MRAGLTSRHPVSEALHRHQHLVATAQVAWDRGPDAC